MCLFTVLHKPLARESGQNATADESVVGLIDGEWTANRLSIVYKIRNWSENGFWIQLAV